MLLEQRLNQFATRMGQQFKTERLAILAQLGNLLSMPTVAKDVAGAITEVYGLATGQVQANRITGMIDAANLPVHQMTKIRKSTALAIADISQADQDAISVDGADGTCNALRIASGELYIYDGGPKTDPASYTALADHTPEWDLIQNKPQTFDSTIAKVAGLDGALSTLQGGIGQAALQAQQNLDQLSQTVQTNQAEAVADKEELLQALAGHEMAIGKRVRYDEAQILTAEEKAQALANIGAQAAVTVGNLVAIFEAELV